MPEKCGNCVFWEPHPELKPPPGLGDVKIGVCYGVPPAMVVVPVETVSSAQGMILASGGQPRTTIQMVPGPVRPHTFASDRGCSKWDCQRSRVL
jgi:hypothetical protein